jgi:hypothetical protein
MTEGSAFFALTPDRVLDAVEIGGLRCTGRCLPVRAFENRVYEVELEDERRLIVKFYRPGRWSRETILDEHRFLADLAAAELPVVPPLDLGTGTTLAETNGILYAAFPKVRGRTLDEGDDERLRQIGRLIGRMHAVGAAADAPHRPRFTVDFYIRRPLEIILAGKFISEPMAGRYRDLALRPRTRSSPRSRRCAPSASTGTCTGATRSGAPTARSSSTSTTAASARPCRTCGSSRVATRAR